MELLIFISNSIMSLMHSDLNIGYDHVFSLMVI